MDVKQSRLSLSFFSLSVRVHTEENRLDRMLTYMRIFHGHHHHSLIVYLNNTTKREVENSIATSHYYRKKLIMTS